MGQEINLVDQGQNFRNIKWNEIESIASPPLYFSLNEVSCVRVG